MSDATNQETVDIANQILAELQQAARDGQMIQNDYYATEADGRSAVADGETFKVLTAGSSAVVLMRRLGASTSEYLGSILLQSALQPTVDAITTKQYLSPFAQQTIDSAGVLMGGVDALTGRNWQLTPRGLWPRRDADVENPLGNSGWPAFLALSQSYAPGTTAKPYRLPDDVGKTLFCIPTLGQSLAGAANDNPNDVIFNPSPTYPSLALMPSVGNKPNGRDFDTLVPLYEYPGTGNDSNFESSLTTMVNTIISTLQAKTGASPRIATFMASRGARTWAQIGPGNDAYAILMKGILGCVKAARKMGLRPVVPAIIYLQGEQDRSAGIGRTEIERQRLNMAREINKSVKMLTGQVEDVVIFISQPNNSVATQGVEPANMLAPVSLDGLGNCRLLPPHYEYTMSNNASGTSSGVHPDSASYVAMGRHLADAVVQEVFGPGYTALKIQRARFVSNTEIDLFYSLTNGPLVVDMSGDVVVPPAWGYAGFQLFDGAGVETAITGAEVRADPGIDPAAGKNLCVVRLTLAAAPSGRSLRLHYATRNDGVGPNSGRLTGARGCVRDSAANPIWANSQVVYL